MKFRKYLSLVSIPAFVLLIASCKSDDFGGKSDSEGDLPITLEGEITNVLTTRANDGGFVDGDEIGVYIVNYNGSDPGILKNGGNHVDNAKFTLNEESGSWDVSRQIFYIDRHTLVDVFGYYPYSNPENVNAYKFSVKTDQSKTYQNGEMGGYEASDFLWGKVAGVEPSANAIRLSMNHKMANLRVNLVEGEGFSSGEWAQLEKHVLITNTVKDAEINLATGDVTSCGDVDSKKIVPPSQNDEWRGIVVPQIVKGGTQLLDISVCGQPYKFTPAEDVSLVSGKMCTFSIKVDKKDSSGKFTFTLIGESITPWESDFVSHDVTAREYFVADLTKHESLGACIAASGNSPDQILNLKVIGEMSGIDFSHLEKMTELEALNLKEAVIVAIELPNVNENGSFDYGSTEEDVIPNFAFSKIPNLKTIVFPDKLKKIESSACKGLERLSCTITLPEGLEVIGYAAFQSCTNQKKFVFPATLKEIGSHAFSGSGISGQLVLPENLEIIKEGAFMYADKLTGELILPRKLKELEGGAFYSTGLTGSLEFPEGITRIPESCFARCAGLDGNLKLHDNIEYIGASAFQNCQFRGELVLPNSLTEIMDNSFAGNRFSGNLIIPDNVMSIYSGAFKDNSDLSGTLEFGDKLVYIGDNAFENCRNIRELVFSGSLENIGSGAFANCFGIGSIVCKSETPPHIFKSTFDGVPKDNFAVEVPESAVEKYRMAEGWCEFKRIVPHRELVCRPATACALSSEHKQTLVIDAEGEWEVASKPDWCELSMASGNEKTEVILTIKDYGSASGERSGEIVFRLKDKDYTTICHVSQYGYQYAEDEYLTLQKATHGNNGGINIVIIGDGYDAKDIATGNYLSDMQQMIEYFFGIEPYTTYRDYFNVYIAFPLSTESGVGTLNTICYNRFGTTYTEEGINCETDRVFDYVLSAPTVNNSNLDETLVILVPNSTDYNGRTMLWESGAAIAICPKSDEVFPYDSRGVIQHYAGGTGFGKLAVENVQKNSFINSMDAGIISYYKGIGWYDNIDITGKMNKVTWSHLIFDPRYSDLVDIYEGGYGYSRGVFRSEQSSCMANFIPYFNTISRQSIVERIKRYVGEPFDFDDFVANDNRNAGSVTRSASEFENYGIRGSLKTPKIYKGSPVAKKRKMKK